MLELLVAIRTDQWFGSNDSLYSESDSVSHARLQEQFAASESNSKQ